MAPSPLTVGFACGEEPAEPTINGHLLLEVMREGTDFGVRTVRNAAGLWVATKIGPSQVRTEHGGRTV